jgi:hypothetical protein
MNDHSWIGGCIFFGEKVVCSHSWIGLNTFFVLRGDRYKVYICVHCGKVRYELIKESVDYK